MTGDQPQPDDILPEDDEPFVIEGLDGESDSDSEAEQTGRQASRPGDRGEDADDILFQPTGDLQSEHVEHSPGPPFEEGGKSAWGGAGMRASEIGIPGAADEQEADAQEVELEQDEVSLDESEEQGGIVEEEATAGSELAAEETGETVEQDPEWAPVEEAEEDVAAAEREAEEQARAEFLEEQAAEAEVAAAAQMAASSTATVVAAPPVRRRSGMRVVVGLAASLVVAAGVVAWQRPEWLGLEPSGEVDRLVISRPSTDVELPVPSLPDTPTSQPTPVVPDVPTPAPRPVVQVDPAPVKDPEPSHPVTDPQPVAVDPTVPAPPVPPVAPDTGQDRDPSSRQPIAVGENLKIGDVDEPVGDGGATAPRSRTGIGSNVVPGVQALAQLGNGNFFIGTIKSVEARELTMRLDKGEVTLAFAELKSIDPIDSREYDRLKKAERGYVRLSNKNRLTGNVLTMLGGDNVVLETKSHRVVIPRSSIEEVGNSDPHGVRLTDSDDDAWVRRAVEEELRAHRSRGKDGATPPAGSEPPK
jgi:hypothetical protein